MSNELKEVFHTMTDAFKEASAEHVYGTPVQSNGTTVIPVAKIAYGFGGGGGEKESKTGEHGPEGMGGGGGAMATPVGVVEIGPNGIRMIPFNDRRKMMAVFGLGALLGSLYASKRIKNMIRRERRAAKRMKE